MFGAVARRCWSILHFFYGIVGNYGIAIIMLTVLVRGAMFPISHKQTQNMARMQELKPEMDRINEKYKTDMQKRSQAMQELYRKHNINPLGGCLPVFLQLPIFMGLYRALMVDVELRQSPLFGQAIRWCSNLAAPDMFLELVVVHAGVHHQQASWSGAVSEYAAADHGRAVPGDAEDVDARADQRAGRHAAEDDEVHDGLHGLHVLQSGQRTVPVLHRLQPVGHRRAEAAAEARRPMRAAAAGRASTELPARSGNDDQERHQRQPGQQEIAQGEAEEVSANFELVREPIATRRCATVPVDACIMSYDPHDTICAIATAAGGAAGESFESAGQMRSAIVEQTVSMRDDGEPLESTSGDGSRCVVGRVRNRPPPAPSLQGSGIVAAVRLVSLADCRELHAGTRRRAAYDSARRRCWRPY